MSVDVSDTAASGASKGVRAAAEHLLELLDCPNAELSVVLCDDAAIRALNRDWRGKDRATDVLSFSQVEDTPRSVHAGRRSPRAVHNPAGASRAGPGRRGTVPRNVPGESLGDVVISVDTAHRQAREGGWTLAEEMNRLLLHGVLHLLGYDHERGGEEAARMHAEEARLSAALIEHGVPCAREASDA